MNNSQMDEELEQERPFPIFQILRKLMNFKHEEIFENMLKEKVVKRIDWIMKPLEECGHGKMQYRLIAIVDGKKCRIEKNNPYQPSSFDKKEAEIYVSKLMDKYPNIEQNVELKKIYNIDKSKFERVQSKSGLKM